MYDHAVKEHNGEVRGGQEDYQMVIVSKDKDIMRRLLREAIRIKRALDKKEEVMRVRLRVQGEVEEIEISVPILLLNSHTEWYMPRLVQVSITGL